MTTIYPHLTVDVDTDSFFEDLLQQYNDSESVAEMLDIRSEITKRSESMRSWLTKHEYQCGQDYFQTETGYRFANNGLAIAFTLAWAR